MAARIRYGSRENVPRRSNWLLCPSGAGPLATVGLTNDLRLAWQLTANVLGRHSCHANDFIATRLAGRNGNGRPRHLQNFCEELDTRFIGAAFDGWCGERKFQRVAEFTGDRILLRARMNADREGDTLRVLLDRNHCR